MGTKDPVLDDTRRLERALKERGIKHEVIYVPKGLHGFHLAIWTNSAQQAWQSQIDFLNRFVSFEIHEPDDLAELDTEESL